MVWGLDKARAELLLITCMWRTAVARRSVGGMSVCLSACHFVAHAAYELYAGDTGASKAVFI